MATEGVSKFDGFDSIDAFCADSCGNLEGDARNRCIRGCRLVEGENWNAEHPAMATEGGADLRERLYLLDATAAAYPKSPHAYKYRSDVDAILGAIAEAGMVIVDAERYGWPIYTNAAGFPEISVVCDGCHKSQYYWPLNANGELEVSPREIGCHCDVDPDDVVQPGDLDGPGGGEGIQPSEWVFGDGETIPKGPAGE